MNVKELKRLMQGAKDDDDVKLLVFHERGQQYTYDIVRVEFTLVKDTTTVKLTGGHYIIG